MKKYLFLFIVTFLFSTQLIHAQSPQVDLDTCGCTRVLLAGNYAKAHSVTLAQAIKILYHDSIVDLHVVDSVCTEAYKKENYPGPYDSTKYWGIVGPYIIERGNMEMHGRTRIPSSLSCSPYILDIIAPNGGEIISEGAPIPVKWKSAGVKKVQFVLSLDSGKKWYDVGTASAESGSYELTIISDGLPHPYSLLRIYDNANPFFYDESDSFFSIEGPSGIESAISPRLAVTCYPNPAEGILYINTAAHINTISIFNITGRAVPCSYNAMEGAVDVSSLPAGFYFVQVGFPGGSKSLIFQKR